MVNPVIQTLPSGEVLYAASQSPGSGAAPAGSADAPNPNIPYVGGPTNANGTIAAPTTVSPVVAPTTPTTTPPTVVTPNQSDAATNFLLNPPSIATPTPNNTPTPEEKAYNEEYAQSEGEVQAVTDYYNNLIANDTSQGAATQQRSNAMAAMMGLSGGGDAASMAAGAAAAAGKATATDLAAKANALQSIYSTIDQNAQSLYEWEANKETTDAQTALTTKNSIIATATAQLDSLASMGISAATLESSDPNLYASLKAQSGYTDFQMANYLQSKMPAQYQSQVIQTYAPDPTNANTTIINRTTVNPQTGQQTTVQYAIDAPYGKVNPNAFQVIGTNLYYQDPTTGNMTLVNPYKPLAAGAGVYNTQTGQSGQALGPAKALSVAPGNSVVWEGGVEQPAGTAPTSNGVTADANGNATGAWSSVPGLSAKAASVLSAFGATPDSAKTQALLWILNGGTVSSTGGMGSAGQVVKQAIADAGTGLLESYGLTAADLPAIAAQNSGLTSAIEQQIGYTAQAKQFEQTAEANLSQVVSEAAGVSVSGSQTLNDVLQKLQNGFFGKAALSNFQTKITTFAEEYSKVMSGSLGTAGATDTSAAQAMSMINSGMNKGQLAGTIAAMRTDMQNRINALNNNVGSLTNSLTNVIQGIASGQSTSSSAGTTTYTPGASVQGADANDAPKGTVFDDGSGTQYTSNGDGTVTNASGVVGTFDDNDNFTPTQ